MKNFLIILTILIGLSSTGLIAQDDPFDPIVKSIRQSDARELAEYFNVTVDLGLPDNDNSYSASQGEMIMKDFFRKYPPDSFEVVQKGSTGDDSRYAIGNYKTGGRDYRVYIHLRLEKTGFRIHKIKFEAK